MRLHIRHVTAFAYAEPVWNSHNVLRACPLTDARQTLLSYHVSVEPRASMRTHVDRWGTQVEEFSVRQPHNRLAVTAESLVETTPAEDPPPVSLEELTAEPFRTSHWAYLQPTRHTRAGRGVVQAAGEAVDGTGSVQEAVDAVSRRVHADLAYRPGATQIGVDVNAVLDAREGVCQDFSHLTIAMLRSVGIPARYVSGYFYAADVTSPDSPVGEPITVQTHAWVEAAVPGCGWTPVDPTNDAPVEERHVVIGRGRDYDDVTPLRGVYSGRSDASLTVEVSMVAGTLGPRNLPVVSLPTIAPETSAGQ